MHKDPEWASLLASLLTCQQVRNISSHLCSTILPCNFKDMSRSNPLLLSPSTGAPALVIDFEVHSEAHTSVSLGSEGVERSMHTGGRW